MYRIILSEFRLQAFHYSSAIAVVLSFLFGVFLINNQTPDVDILTSGPYFIIKTFAVQLLLTPGLIAMFAHRASVRDFEHNMDGLIYTATTHLKTLLSVRLLVLIALNCFVFLAFGLGLIAGLVTHSDASMSLGLMTLSWIMGVLVLPNTILISTVFFVIGLRAKQSLHIYIVAISLFFAYQFFLMASGSPLMASNISPNKALMPWYICLDPYGLSLFFEHIKEWSIAQKNQLVPDISPQMMVNRLGVVGGAVLLAWLGIKHHLLGGQFTTTGNALGKHHKYQPLREQCSRIGSLVYLPVTLLSRAVSSLLPYSSTLVVASMTWRLTIRTKTFLALSLVLLIATISEVYFGYMNLESLGTQAMPTTLITLNRYLGDILPQFCGFFIVLLCAELCWRDPSNKIKALVDCTPINSRSIFIGRMVTISFVPIFFVTSVIALSMTIQAMFGGEIMFRSYLLLYPYIVIPLMILAAACIVINHLVPNKYWALSLSLLWFIWMQSSFPSSLGFTHPLWTLGLNHRLIYSDLTGFDGQLAMFWETNLLRAACVALGCIVCLKLSTFREKMFSHDLGKLTFTLLFSTGALFVLVMLAHFFLQIHYFGDYQSAEQRHQWKADYETRFKHRQHMPSLQQKSAKLYIDVYPQQGTMSIDAEYILENTFDKPISELFFNTPKPFSFTEIRVEKGLLEQFDPTFNTHLYRFETPINPGQRVTLNVKATLAPSGYQKVESDKVITTNYVYLRMLRYMPWIGYVSQYELKDNNLRAEFGLASRTEHMLDQSTQKPQQEHPPQYQRVDLQTTIITSADHFALAPGKLINQWQEGTRRGFHYETQAPVANVAHLISTSMPYLQKEIEQTSVKVFYPSGKQQHGQKHLAAIQDTLQYATDHFGQYDYAQFNLVPASVALPTVGYALPQMALIGEGVGFHANLNESDGFDHLYRRTVHEVAHQWWGYGLNIAEVEGSGVLAETLAKYTELVILRRKYGQDYVKRLVEFEQGRYFKGRSRDTIKELPLYRADSNYLIYSKGSAAMYGVSELLGETRVNQALRKLLTSHAPPAPPATTLDLIRYLNEVASESEQAVINSWFKEIHVNDVAIESVSIKHQNSEYNVTVCVIDHQEASHSVQLSAFAANGKLIEMKEFAKSAVNPACLDWTLMSKPKYFEVDANLLLLDSNRENNIYQVPNR